MSPPRPLPFFLPYVVPLITILTQYSPRPAHSLLPIVFVWIFIPLIDLAIPPTRTHPRLTHAELRHLESRLSFKLAVYSWCPVQLAMLIWAASRVSHPTDAPEGLRLLGLVWSTALIAAEGINCSHELLHRRSRPERFLAHLLLVSVMYGHFVIEHARGHHFTVATPHDPATMRFGESVYRFLPRTILGGYKSAWRLEVTRLTRERAPVWGPHNAMLRYAAGQAAFVVGFYTLFGIPGLLLFLFQATVAIILLEQINAIEHYGLERKAVADGYERVGPKHSWDAPHRVSSYLLFKLQVHADHHLRTFAQAPFPP